jgi:hypothetical protein
MNRAGLFLFTFVALSNAVYADIPWPEVLERIKKENAVLAKRPQGHNGRYFVVCTLYYTPRESGFTAQRGFDVKAVKAPGLGGRSYGADFLAAVNQEGIGRLTKPVGGKHYLRYEGRGRYGFCNHPTGLKRGKIVSRLTCAVRSRDLDRYRPGTLHFLDPTISSVFGNSRWVVGDTGALKSYQVDLYWGEDDPMGPGLTGRPRGTQFEYSLTFVDVERPKSSSTKKVSSPSKKP